MLYPLVLVIMTLLLILGGAMLSHQSGYRKAAVRDVEQAQARLLAQAGLEDVRLKWERDPSFPPSGEDVERFSYRENLLDADGHLLGSYEVEIDLRHASAPSQVLLVTSRGVTAEGAMVSLIGEWDLANPPRKPGSRWLGLGSESARQP